MNFSFYLVFIKKKHSKYLVWQWNNDRRWKFWYTSRAKGVYSQKSWRLRTNIIISLNAKRRIIVMRLKLKGNYLETWKRKRSLISEFAKRSHRVLICFNGERRTTKIHFWVNQNLELADLRKIIWVWKA